MHAPHARHVVILIIYAFFSRLLLGLPPMNPTSVRFSMFVNNLNTVMLFICHILRILFSPLFIYLFILYVYFYFTKTGIIIISP